METQLKNELKYGARDSELEYLLSISSSRIQNIYKLHCCKGMTYTQIDKVLGIKCSSFLMREWKNKVNRILRRLRIIQSNNRSIAALNVDMALYRKFESAMIEILDIEYLKQPENLNRLSHSKGIGCVTMAKIINAVNNFCEEKRFSIGDIERV